MRKQQILYKQFWTKIKTRQETNSKHIKIVPDEKKKEKIFLTKFFSQYFKQIFNILCR